MAARSAKKARRFHKTRRGVGALLDDLEQLSEPATIGLEATGHYWLALHDELVRAGHTVQVLNPLQTHAYRKTTIRKLKTVARLGVEKAQALQAAARDSLGMTRLGGVASFELRALLDQITFLEQQGAAVEQQIEARLAKIEQHVTDIKGISPVMAASLIAEIASHLDRTVQLNQRLLGRRPTLAATSMSKLGCSVSPTPNWHRLVVATRL
jgi:transposase